MLEESDDKLLGRVLGLTRMDVALCKILMSAVAGHPDDDTAEAIMRRVREHTSLSNDPEEMYDIDHYLDYVKDLVDLSEGFEKVGKIKIMHESIKDTYEVFLYNRESLAAVLNQIRRKEQVDAMRQNYWMN